MGASKRIETNRTIAKVAGPNRGPPPAKKRRFMPDKTDLRFFLDKGAFGQYSGRKDRCQQLYSSYTCQGQKTTGALQQTNPKSNTSKET